MGASQVVVCHFLILDFPDVAADSVDKYGKSLISVLHRGTSEIDVEVSTGDIIAQTC